VTVPACYDGPNVTGRHHEHTDAPPDTLFAGTLFLHQPARGEGYRVNVDAVLLAAFAGSLRHARCALDLGAGVGAVGLCLLYRDRATKVILLDRDAALCRLAIKNLDANGWQDRGQAHVADVTRVAAVPERAADLVVCNPPYVVPGRGRVPAIAPGARMGDLDGFIVAARHALAARGRACFIYPAVELITLAGALRQRGLEPKRLRMVHADAGQPARVALVEAAPGKPGGLIVEPPLFERDGPRPSQALEALLAPR
jgi:tRNA1Val (adenine37-N6)-methyltransferase